MFAVVVQGDDLILAGLYAQQRDPHVVLHADHDIPFSGAGLDDDAGFGSLELPFGDAYPVAFDKLLRFRRVDGDHVGVRIGYPLQVCHRFLGEIGMIFVFPVFDTGQEIVLGQPLFHPVNLVLRGVDEYIVIQQRATGFDKPAVSLFHLHIRRCEIFE